MISNLIIYAKTCTATLPGINAFDVVDRVEVIAATNPLRPLFKHMIIIIYYHHWFIEALLSTPSGHSLCRKYIYQ